MSWAVRLGDAGKRYVKYEDLPLLVTRLRLRAGGKRSHLWAVRHVDLEVEEGETVGVIGRNGSGKSTTLRMLAGVTAPTEGVVSVRGRVAPLIAVGVGFHPELTGRENVYVNGLVLGLSRAEVDRLFSSIVQFAELSDFIDTPVKFYSSGMFVRLGFSVAVASRPEVLLVDEVLAVGDLAFQAKCFDRMEEIKAEGTSILVVSHNLNAVRRLCSRTLLLHDGSVRFLGGTDEAIAAYHQILGETGEAGESRAGEVEILDFVLLGPDGRPSGHLRHGDRATFRIDARFERSVEDPIFALRVTTDSGQIVYSESTYLSGSAHFEAGERARCDIEIPMALVTGSYTARASVSIRDADGAHATGRPVSFFISGRPLVRGVADLEATFRVATSPDAADQPPSGAPGVPAG